MSSNSIIVEGIEFYGYHGDLPQERELGQRYVVDLTLTVATSKAGVSDRLEDTIDYAAVVTRVHEIGTGEQYHLIEALAERIAAVILKEFLPDEVSVRVTKPRPPIPLPVRRVTLAITRRRS
jgi:dihydroneopterin aldolase